MDMIAGLAHGFAVLLSPMVLAACVLGLLAGMVAGFLPALSPAGALALAAAFVGWMLGPFGLQSPAVFLVAFAYGTLYGRALAALNLDASSATRAAPSTPAERSALIVTLLIGIGAAIGAAAFAVAGKRGFALSFGPIELSALIAFVLLGGAAFARGSAASSLAVVVLGLLLALVGTDIETGLPRLTFGSPVLADGLSLLEIALGLFVIANAIDDVVRALVRRLPDASAEAPGRSLWSAALLAVLAGFLPTNGETFAATAGARRARGGTDLLDPASQRGFAAIIRAAMLSDIRLSVSMIALLLWLAPVDAMTALLRGPVYFQAVLTRTVADLAPIAWLIGATLVVAHVVPLALIAGLARARWPAIRIDARVVAPLLAAVACLAVWQAHDSDPRAVVVMLAFGLIGYAMIRGRLDRSLMLFAFAVGPMFEENIRRTLLIARGDPTAYLQRPISAIALIAGVLIFVIVRAWRRRAGGTAAPQASTATPDA